MRVLSEGLKREIAKMYTEGWGAKYLAGRFGTTPNVVYKAAAKYGQQKRKGYPKGENSHAWKGGRYTTDEGYVRVYSPGHLYANAAGYVLEHRLVMEKVLGRTLEPHEVVHHLDEDKQNNDPSNLEVLTTTQHHGEHYGVGETVEQGAITDYTGGMPMAEVLRKYGICKSTLYNVLRRHEVPLRRRVR